MTTVQDALAGPSDPSPSLSAPPDHRRSPIPTVGMIVSRFTELSKRRGLMVLLVLVTVGIPGVFLAIRLILHAAAPKTYGPAGGYDIYTGMVSGVLYTFGFIVAAALGATAGSSDLTEGMFRHEVVTGRSRLALYLARIPAGFAIIGSLVAVGFAIVCAVCVFAAPTHLHFDGVSVPGHLSRTGLQNWAADHADEVVCDFDFRAGPSSPLASVVSNVPCGRGPGPSAGPKAIIASPPGAATTHPPSRTQVIRAARLIAAADYPAYSSQFLSPPVSLMVKSGLWLELGAFVGFIVGLGLGSLTGQRTVTIVLMIILEVVLTPILSRAHIPHMINLQRAVVGLATAHLAPGGLPVLGGGGGGPGGGNGNPELIPETTLVASLVVTAWLVGWTIIGAWRMMTRDA
jgi:hypothetical protein